MKSCTGRAQEICIDVESRNIYAKSTVFNRRKGMNYAGISMGSDNPQRR